ncbi:hypothetical protein B566_EDAN002572 [Ephemera danica]|nr:hypothetical protein B566_EDAN002572 [Ephemera danica]
MFTTRLCQVATFTRSLPLTKGVTLVWFKNRRAKWRKQKREEQERLRKLHEDTPRQDDGIDVACRPGEVSSSRVAPSHLLQQRDHLLSDESSDVEVA